MQKAREAFLDRVNGHGDLSVLTLGEGPGGFLTRLCGSVRASRFFIIEPSSKMRALQWRKLQSNPFGDGSHEFHYFGSLEEFLDWARHRTPVTIDVVVTHFFFDMFDEDGIRGIIRSVNPLTVEAGRWWWADFQIVPGGRWWRRMRASVLLRVMYFFFGMVSGLRCRRLANAQPLFTECGWTRTAVKSYSFGFISAGEWTRTGSPGSQPH